MQKVGQFFKKHIKLIIVIVVIAVIALFVRKKVMEAKQMIEEAMDTSFTTTVEKMDLVSSVSVTGTLQAIDSAAVTSTATGVKIEKIEYEVGDYVEEGTTVVTFDGDDYEERVAELNAKYNITDVRNQKELSDGLQKISDAEKAIEDNQEDIEEIEKYLEDNKHIYENLVDARDEYIFVQQNYAPDYSAYKQAEERYNKERAAALIMADPVSIEIYEEKEEKVKKLKDNIEKLELDLENAKYQYDLSILNQEYDSDYTKANSYEDVYEQIDNTKVTAPISGYITSINVTEGNNYTAGSTVFTISDTSSFVVEATVDEYDIASLAEGQKCVVKFEATDEDEFGGDLTYVAIAPESETASVTSAMSGVSTTSASSTSNGYKIKITLNDNDERLRVGMTAKASVILDSVKDVFAVAYDCVEDDEDGKSFITAVDEEGNETKIYVTKGLESDYYVEISAKELKEGMTIKATASSRNHDNDWMNMMGGPGGPGPDGEF